MREEELTMMQEAVFDSIDEISSQSLFAECEVLCALADVYMKSAMIQESASVKGEVNADQIYQGEKWYQKVIRFIIKIFEVIRDAVVKFFKELPKRLRGLKQKLKNGIGYKSGRAVFTDDENREIIRVKNYNADDAGDISATVIYEYDPRALKRYLDDYLEMVKKGDSVIPEPDKSILKRTELDIDEVTKLEDLSDTIKMVIGQLRSAKDQSENETTQQAAAKTIKWLAKVSEAVVKSNLSFIQALGDNAEYDMRKLERAEKAKAAKSES